MKNIAFIINEDKDPKLAFAGALAETAEALGFVCRIDGDVFDGADFALVLGGDGTMLSAAKSAALRGIPIMGINLGKLGYLTTAERSGAAAALEAVAAGRFRLDRRIMLEAALPGGKTLCALNDVCLSKNTALRPCAFELRVNGELIGEYAADGLIVATPTGSTAYNLSAGGPVMKPDAEMIALTPVCPHNLRARPLVISSGDAAAIKNTNPGNAGIIVSSDGAEAFLLPPGGEIEIKKSPLSVGIIRTREIGFYDILREKFAGR